jgi:hypothetical protein
MSKVYLIKPLEKKSISVVYEMFRENADGSISWFNIEDHYRWGQGFIEEDMDANLPYKDSDTAYCKSDCGWGCELEDSVAVFFDFSEDLDQEQQQAIKDAYCEGGAGWLHDGDHEWQFEDDAIIVLAPFQVDLCEEDGTVIEKNIKLQSRPKVSNSWPILPTTPEEEEAFKELEKRQNEKKL